MAVLSLQRKRPARFQGLAGAIAAWRWLLPLSAGLWLGAAATAGAQSASLEYAVKANYLYKFTPFVEWPARAYASPTSPFAICVAGQDPFGPLLDRAVQGQQVDGHPIVVRRLAVAEPGAGCHMLFAGHSSRQSTAQMLSALAGQPVLTVTDQAAKGAGGMIQFVLQDGRVRFAIDAKAAAAGGLTISSKLLGLAVSVRTALK